MAHSNYQRSFAMRIMQNQNPNGHAIQVIALITNNKAKALVNIQAFLPSIKKERQLKAD